MPKQRFADSMRHLLHFSRSKVLHGNFSEPNRLLLLALKAWSFDVLAIHQELFSAFSDERGGQLREEQNWIGGEATGPQNAEFVPPPPEYVANLLDDLCVYLERDDLPAVMQAAIVHAQFETIHPFADGNGRVGRCLIHVVLRRRGVAPSFVPPVSLILATDAKAYVRKLSGLQRLNPKIFHAYLLKESLTAILSGRQPNVAQKALDDWRAWASRSRLKPFVKLAGTIERFGHTCGPD